MDAADLVKAEFLGVLAAVERVDVQAVVDVLDHGAAGAAVYFTVDAADHD